MPRICSTSNVQPILQAQDWVIGREQALAAGLTAEALRYRLRIGKWRPLLPEVYVGHPGEPSRRQLLIAAQIYAGEDAAIDGVDACRYYGVKSIATEESRVHVVVPHGSPTRSRWFVVVRRTAAPITPTVTDRIRYVDPATALISATRQMASERRVLAVLSEGLQTRLVSYDDLVRAHIQGTPRNSRHADEALEHLGAGTRSLPEADFRTLATASTILPTLGYNVWLRLNSGRVVCVDALVHTSAVIHETNGRSVHARADLFDDMQERHDALTAEGFTVLHNSPRRLRLRGRDVIAEVERCHVRHEGRGLPAGVAVLAAAA
jgi:hypothetical protein